MRARNFGTGLVFGLAVTVFGSPVAWADNVPNQVPNQAPQAANETVAISEVAPLPAVPGDPDAQLSQQPRVAPQTDDEDHDADDGEHLSMSLLAVGMALGAGAGAGAIVWREIRR